MTTNWLVAMCNSVSQKSFKTASLLLANHSIVGAVPNELNVDGKDFQERR